MKAASVLPLPVGAHSRTSKPGVVSGADYRPSEVLRARRRVEAPLEPGANRRMEVVERGGHWKNISPAREVEKTFSPLFARQCDGTGGTLRRERPSSATRTARASQAGRIAGPRIRRLLRLSDTLPIGRRSATAFWSVTMRGEILSTLRMRERNRPRVRSRSHNRYSERLSANFTSDPVTNVVYTLMPPTFLMTTFWMPMESRAALPSRKICRPAAAECRL